MILIILIKVFYFLKNKILIFLDKQKKKKYIVVMMNNIDNYNYKFLFCIESVNESLGYPNINTNHDIIGIHMKDIEGNYLHEYIREFYEIKNIKKNPKDIKTIFIK